jgi:hypothetical protein
MAGELHLFVDTKRRICVESASSSRSATLPTFVQQDTIQCFITFLAPNASLAQPYQLLDFHGFECKAGMVAGTGKATGTIGSPPLLAFFCDFAWDSENKRFVGELHIDAGETSDFLGAAWKKLSKLEVKVVQESDGARVTLLQQTISVAAQVIEDGLPVEPESSSSSSEGA